MDEVDVISNEENIKVDGLITFKLPKYITPKSNIKIACDIAYYRIHEMNYRTSTIYDLSKNQLDRGYKYIHKR